MLIVRFGVGRTGDDGNICKSAEENCLIKQIQKKKTTKYINYANKDTGVGMFTNQTAAQISG